MAMLTLRIGPQAGELSKALLHSATVRRRLNSSFDFKRMVRIGSHSRGTAIRTFSDVDFLAVLARNEAKWGGNIISSSTFLRKVRDDLQDRYASTEVRTDEQAVIVEFGGGQHAMDLVPAVFARIDRGRPVYLIPDGDDGWLETAPEAHNRYFSLANQKSGGKLSGLVKLLKWWKFSREDHVPVQSFHLDMLFASSDVCTGVKPYTRCLHDAFRLLDERECRGFRDPLGISGVNHAAKTQSQLGTVVSAVSYAYEHAKSAIYAEAWKDFAEANRQWNIVFNGKF
jgi:hypothetical protein